MKIFVLGFCSAVILLIVFGFLYIGQRDNVEWIMVDSNEQPIRSNEEDSNSTQTRFVSASRSVSPTYFNRTSNQRLELKDSKVELEEGEAVLSGKVTIQGNPIEGVRLALYLDENLMTEWAETDKNGIYNISVPGNTYEITGYYIESSKAKESFKGRFQIVDRNNFTLPIKVNLETAKKALAPNFDFYRIEE